MTTPSFTSRMMGFMLPHEQFPIDQLVEFGEMAEKAGFDLLATSDHLQPWQSNEGHSGMAWVTMGALGQRTRRVWMGPTVTCPTFRYNPAVVAEGFASLDIMYPGRIFLGVGSGEALNEQAAVGTWPKWDERSCGWQVQSMKTTSGTCPIIGVNHPDASIGHMAEQHGRARTLGADGSPIRGPR